ncbi:cell envelope integrity protein TolA [Paenibacillus odorifer]|uniref:Uncharacterized protein n=1 Tax=Paenibacillus odorifer TaxID=189426 RepID=A0A1R0XKP7_9BACL|nr:cell envelope integrity protein TolA [Paenibacillus odorifer]OMD35675.1 hypothetical protein BSK52_26610 [Paenibacillus odorifer]
MDILFFLLSVLTILLIMIGMINPRLLLPKGLEHRKRKQIFILYIPLLCIFVFAFFSVLPEITTDERAQLEAKRLVQEKKEQALAEAKNLTILNEEKKAEELKKKQLEEAAAALKKQEAEAEIKRKEEEKLKLAAEIKNKQEEIKLKAQVEQDKKDNQYTLGITPKQFLRGFNSALEDIGIDLVAKTQETKNFNFEFSFMIGKDQFIGIKAFGLLNKDGTIRALYFHQNAVVTDSHDFRYARDFNYILTSVIKAINGNMNNNDSVNFLNEIYSDNSAEMNGLSYDVLTHLKVDGEKLELSIGNLFVKKANDKVAIHLIDDELKFEEDN